MRVNVPARENSYLDLRSSTFLQCGWMLMQQQRVRKRSPMQLGTFGVQNIKGTYLACAPLTVGSVDYLPTAQSITFYGVLCWQLTKSLVIIYGQRKCLKLTSTNWHAFMNVILNTSPKTLQLLPNWRARSGHCLTLLQVSLAASLPISSHFRSSCRNRPYLII